MGKRGKNWFRAVKKVFSPESREKKDKKSKRLGLENPKPLDSFSHEIPQSSGLEVASHLPSASTVPTVEVGKSAEVELEQSKHVCSSAIANESATVAAVAATAQDVHLTPWTNFSGKSREEAATIKIQTAFRGYMARRALRALRGLVRLKSLVHGNAVKRQATTTLRCMQTLARVQSQIRSRRIQMIEDNQILQRQLLLKRERELETLRMNEEWDDSIQSKQQIEAGLLSKQEASIRRERALAYAFSHQWKSSSKSAKPTFMDPNNPQWGWSWLERWMAARPWETRSTASDKELPGDRTSIKSSNGGGEIIKAYALRDAAVSASPKKSTRLPSRQSPGTGTPRSHAVPKMTKSASPRHSWAPADDDSRSMISIQSERPRRHSLAGSVVRDDESMASSQAVPSYMAPTRSARAKTRISSTPTDLEATITEKGSPKSAKKKLSFPSSPARAVRRHSGPPRVDVSVVSKPEVATQ